MKIPYSRLIRFAQVLALPLGTVIASAGSATLPEDTLRGYGELEITFEPRATANESVGLIRFDAEDAAHAATAVGKFLSDIELSAGSRRSALEVHSNRFPLVEVEGGPFYTGFASGKLGYVAYADSLPQLESYLSDSTFVRDAQLLDTALDYPSYLDRFDRYGWGFYGFSGATNWHEWKKVLPDAGIESDPQDDLDFLKEYDFRFEIWPQPAKFDDNYGIGEWPELWWEVEEAQKGNIYLGSRLYGDIPYVKEYADLFEQPAPFLQGGWVRKDLRRKSWTHLSWFNEKGRLYMARQAQEQMRPLMDVELGSWMSPFGELVHDSWYNFHQDYSSSALNDWRHYLQEVQGLSLTEVSQMFNREEAFSSWDEVPIPEVATFAGLPGCVLDLEGDWRVRAEASADEGLEAKWWLTNTDSADWQTMWLPGSIKYHQHFTEMAWMTREFELSAELLDSEKPLYLYDFARATYGDPHKPSLVYLNGEKLGETSRWGVWEVGQQLKPGTNRLSIRSDYFSGRVFLSTEAPSVYPYLSPERNRLWVLYQEWDKDAKQDTWEVTLAAMREVEPNVPIKYMAPSRFGTDRWIELSTKYGGWPHHTGEGTWFFPWYKRYGFLYGLPGTSEMAGPQENALGMFRTMQRTFLAGLNGLDHVFFVQAATRRPDVKQFYVDHATLLKQMGRYDIAGPQVLIYRSTHSASNLMPQPNPSLGESTRPFQEVWNWDIGRGTLQSIGHSYLYIDDGGLHDGKLEGYSVLFDAGNEIMRPESIEAIEGWVRDGGTYVVYPFTGRCAPDAGEDTWPIEQLTGCTVSKMRQPGSGTVTVAEGQTLLRELAGQSFPDAGAVKDYQGFDHNILSTELEAGPDTEVIATFENGSPAIVSRSLGKGRVITLGSVFFKDVKDEVGIWLPGESEAVFYRDLLEGLGQPAVNSTNDIKVLTQRFKTNNGLDEMVMLVNFAGEDRVVDLTAVFENQPSRVYRVAMDQVEPITGFTAEDTTIRLNEIMIPKDEVQLYYFRTGTPETATTHWWDYQRRIWQSEPIEKVDFSPIAGKRWQEPVLNLKKTWHWTQRRPAGEAWKTETAAFAEWPTWHLDLFNAVGADPEKPVYAAYTFELPPTWLDGEGKVRLTAADWNRGAGDLTAGHSPWKLWLNGTLLEKAGFFNPEVTELLHSGTNTLAIAIEPPTLGKDIGVIGAVYLTYASDPVATVDLAGEWQGERNGEVVTVEFPGTAEDVFWPTKVVPIPAEWADQYIVTYYAKDPRIQSGQSTDLSSMGVIVNEREARRRHHHMHGNEVEVDITALLKFGEPNELTPLAVGWLKKDTVWKFDQIELRLYPREDYRD